MVTLISEKVEYKNITTDNEGDFRVTKWLSNQEVTIINIYS